MNDCVFCQIAAGTAESWMVYETEYACAFLDINPVNEYHTLVIPKRHYENLFDVPDDVLVQVTLAVKQVAGLYRDKLGIENLQIISCAGADAQQDIFHLHFHIVPRYPGDQQDIVWSTHPEMRVHFEEQLARLHRLMQK